MAGPIRIAILSNGRQARADIARTAGSLGAMQRTASRATKVIAGVFAVRSLYRAAAAVGKVGGEYVDSLNKIQALTDSTDTQMGRIASRLEAQSGAFAKFGQTTGDAAQGMVELTKSGLTAEKALGAIRGTMTLAKAGEMEVARASELVANTLNTFGLKASKAADIANSLANAANISSADVSDLAESFKYVSPLAAKAGISVDQTNAILAELANSGIKASQAGTSLRAFLLSLQAPSSAGSKALDGLGVSVYNAQGKMRPLPSLIDQLNGALSKVSDQRRNADLKTIFGRVGLTGAQVILKNGTKGLAEYTKGVKRAGAATKLAASASKGLGGTWKSMKASATSTVQELYRRFSPALDARLQSVADHIAENKDEWIDAGIAAGKRLGPALKSLAELAGDAAVAFKNTAGPIAKDLLPAIGDLVELAGDAAGFLSDLPGPVKDIGVQAGIAALILPRLSAGVTSVTSSVALNIARLQQWRAEMTYSVTRTQQLSAMTARLGAAARTAAGIGGMVALAQGAQHADTKLGLLGTTAGGALMGFSVGGPWGAAVGAGAGALYGLKRAADASREAFRASITINKDYADSFDQVTGAITKATKQTAFGNLQNQGVLDVTRMIGIPDRAAVAAAVGNVEAIERIAKRVRELTGTRKQLTGPNADMFFFNKQSAADFINGLKYSATQLDEEQKAFIRALDASKSFGRSLKGIPKNVRTEVRALGLAPSRKQINALRDEYHLTPKQVRTIVKAVGVDKVRGDAKRTRTELESVGRAKGDVSRWKRDLGAGVRDGQRRAGQGSVGILRELEKVEQARANLGPFANSVRTGVGPAKEAASTGGAQVGANLKSGVLAGFSGTAAALAAAAASAVRQAVAAARAAGKIHSPSQETRDKVGKPLAQGIIVGFLKGVRDGSAGISRALDKLMKLIEKKYSGKKQAARRKAVIRSLRDERAALIANGKAQDRVNRKLEKAEQQYKSLRQKADEFAASIKSGFLSYGSVVGLGTTGGGSAVTLPALLSQLGARAAVAEQFASVIEALRGKLNKTSLKQLLEQAASGDLEGALATAQAIASGGDAAIAQINALTAQIAEAGKKLGEKMRREFYGHGLKVAEGVVKGLEKRQRELDRIADRLAKEFLRQAGLGTRGGKGGGGGGNKRAGATPSAKRTPATDAYMSTRAPAPAPTTVTVRFTADQVSQLQRGREIQADLDFYHGAGGRAKVRTA